MIDKTHQRVINLERARHKLGVKSIRQGFGKEMMTYLELTNPPTFASFPNYPPINSTGKSGETAKKEENCLSF